MYDNWYQTDETSYLTMISLAGSCGDEYVALVMAASDIPVRLRIWQFGVDQWAPLDRSLTRNPA